MALIQLCLLAVPLTKISAIIYTHNHALHIGRALDSLRSCDETIVVDHSSKEIRDDILRVAREHGARILRAISGADIQVYVQQASHDWLLCLLPEESVAEDLETSLFEWRMQKEDWRLEAHAGQRSSFSIAIREQFGQQWRLLPPETRLVHRSHANWNGALPSPDPDAIQLEGHILRIPDIK